MCNKATYPIQNGQIDPCHICTVSKVNSLWGIYKDHHMKGLNVKGVTALQKGKSQNVLFCKRLLSKFLVL